MVSNGIGTQEHLSRAVDAEDACYNFYIITDEQSDVKCESLIVS